MGAWVTRSSFGLLALAVVGSAAVCRNDVSQPICSWLQASGAQSTPFSAVDAGLAEETSLAHSPILLLKHAHVNPASVSTSLGAFLQPDELQTLSAVLLLCAGASYVGTILADSWSSQGAEGLRRFMCLAGARIAWLLCLQWATALAVRAFEASGVYQRTHPVPPITGLRMLWADIIWAASYVVLSAAVDAALDLQWSYAAPNFFILGLWVLLMIHFLDTYYYFMHRWFHSNKTVFRLFHATHHSHHGNLNIESCFYLNFLGGNLEGGVPLAAILLASHTVFGNRFFDLGALHHIMFIALIGHAGVDAQFKHPCELLYVLLDPFTLLYVFMPYRHVPGDHEQHHRDPRTNLAPFFSLWDDLLGTGPKDSQGHWTTPVVVAAHAAHVAAFFGGLLLLSTYPVYTLATYAVAYLVIQPNLVASVFNVLGIPEAVRVLVGGLMDSYRENAHITYAVAGTPGSFDAACKDKDKSSTFIFACHPTGTLSRGALLTFGARGWRSPVSALPRVRLAVGSALLRMPLLFSREALLACGCTPADRGSLEQLLLSGTSIALAPGGWSEPTHTSAYDLLLKSRTGFVRLAAATKTPIVPVMCLGEHLVGSAPHLLGSPSYWRPFVNWAFTLAVSQKPNPVQVVFGEAVVPQEGEGVAELHGRYTAALLALGKQQGVALNIM